MKKLFVMLMVLLVAGSAFAGGSKDKGAGSGKSDSLGPAFEPVGEWRAYDDQDGNAGSSTAVLTSAEETVDGKTVTVYTIKGNITTQYQYGFAGWAFDPDEETLEKIKTASGFSFKVFGDGKRYAIKYKTSDCETDYCYYEFGFNTEPGQWTTIEVPMKMFMQPSWGIWKKLNMNNFTGVEWQTHENWRKTANDNPYEVKICEFKVHN